MRGLGLDLSTVKTGFAFGAVGDRAPRGGVWRLPGAANDAMPRTLSSLYDSIVALHTLFPFEKVAIEAPFRPSDGLGNDHTNAVLAQLTGAARAAVFRCGALEYLVASQTVRKHFLGRGDVSSAEAKDYTVARCDALGWPCRDDNQGDANATWSWLMATHFKGHAAPANFFPIIEPRRSRGARGGPRMRGAA